MPERTLPRRFCVPGASLLLLLTFLGTGQAQPAVQVADLKNQGSNGDGLDLTPMLEVGGVVYFRGRDAAHGWELWRTEGTAESTRLVRDICPGPCDSSPAELTGLGGEVYFFAEDGLTGRELWRSDGTAAGTLLVRDVCPGSCGAISNLGLLPRAALVRAGDRLFFRADDSSYGIELWTSDGTFAGTRRVTDLCPGPCSGQIFDLTAAGTEVVFRGDDPAHGLEPWRSDGTAEGTSLLGDFCRGTCSSALTGDQGEAFFPFQGGLLVWIQARPTCLELWPSDPGLRSGPLPRLCADHPVRFPRLAELNGTPYFGFEGALWKVELLPFQVKKVEQLQGTPANLMRMGSQLVFTGLGHGFGIEIFRTDGTPGGTSLLKDTDPGQDYGYPGNLTLAGGRLYFTSGGGPHRPTGGDLWVSDGTPTGTMLLRPLPPEGPADQIYALTPLGDRLLFTARRTDTGQELWSTDGTRQGTALLRDLHDDPGSADPRGFAAIGGSLFFGALRPGHPYSLYGLFRTDGTAAGTSDLGEQGYPRASALFEEALFFDSGYQLFKTDGTGIVPFGQLSAGEILPVGARLFLSASGVPLDPGAIGMEPWISDGSVLGTRLIKDILPGMEEVGPLLYLPRSSAPRGLTPLGSGLLFVARDEEHGEELWRSEGSTQGTVLVEDLCPGDCSPEIEEPTSFATSFGTRVFFSAKDAASGRELWISNGSAEGTRLFVDLVPGAGSSSPRDLTVFGGRLLFFAADAQGSERLWSSDGTAPGTIPLAVTAAPGQPRTPHEPVAAGGRLFFTAWTEAAGQELWATDGTVNGTRLVRDLMPGPASSYPRELTAAGNILLFSADDGQTGHELWMSTGTSGGMRRLQDVSPGPTSSAPAEITPAGSRIFFAADGGVQGRELWTMDAAALASSCAPGPNRLCLADGRFGVTVRWRDQHNGGREGVGTAVPDSHESGFFWFFQPANLELVVKILDGRGTNQHYWFFYGALSDVEYWVTVTDHETGEEKTWHNPPGTFCGRADTKAFAAEGQATAPDFALIGAAALELPAPAEAAGSCVPGPDALCLLGGRFRVQARWKNQHDGGTEGEATAVTRTDETGSFWFFDPANTELLVKILDGRPLGGKFWVFSGSLSDVEYWITVTDTATGVEKTYHNPPGSYCGRADTRAF